MSYSLLTILIGIFVQGAAFAQLPEGLLTRLNASQVSERERARVELLEWAADDRERGLEVLSDLLQEDLDPEVAARVYRVLKTLYFQKKTAYFGVGFVIRPEIIYRKEQMVGVQLSSVKRESPAAKAGLKRGDIMIALNAERFPADLDDVDVRRLVGALEVGKKQKITVLRKQKKLTIVVRPVERPELIDQPGLKEEAFHHWLQLKSKQ